MAAVIALVVVLAVVGSHYLWSMYFRRGDALASQPPLHKLPPAAAPAPAGSADQATAPQKRGPLANIDPDTILRTLQDHALARLAHDARERGVPAPRSLAEAGHDPGPILSALAVEDAARTARNRCQGVTTWFLGLR